VARDDARFPTTRWSLVVDAADSQGHERRLSALADLIEMYRPALEAFASTLTPATMHADDIVQQFLLDRVLQGRLLSHADASQGRFRALLKASLRNFVRNQIRDAHRQKRSPGTPMLPAEQVTATTDAEDPSGIFEAEWARSIVRQALLRVREECQRKDRPDIWAVFETRVVKPSLTGESVDDYDSIVDQHQLPSSREASNLLQTGKRMYVRALRAVVADYVATESEIDQEIMELRTILARGA